MDVKKAVAEGAKRLAAAGVDSPRLDAELLLGHVLGVDRAGLFTRTGRNGHSLSSEQETEFGRLLARRVSREPLAYILRRKEFYGLDFYVDRRVLVPRPETELLVEHALEAARTQGPPPGEPLRLADIGTGSGAIAVTLAVRLPETLVQAVDSSAEALEVARLNVERHNVAERVRLLHGDLLTALEEPADLVVANLPYVAAEDLPGLQPEVRDFEPALALDGGPGGLATILRLLNQIARRRRRPRAVLLEIGAGQGIAVVSAARHTFPHAAVSLLNDYAGLNRIVIINI